MPGSGRERTDMSVTDSTVVRIQWTTVVEDIYILELTEDELLAAYGADWRRHIEDDPDVLGGREESPLYSTVDRRELVSIWAMPRSPNLTTCPHCRAVRGTDCAPDCRRAEPQL